MKLKSIKSATKFAKNFIYKTYKEITEYEEVMGKNFSVIWTNVSVFLVKILKEEDRVDFSKIFSQLANKIFWREGIIIEKNLLLDFIEKTRDERAKEGFNTALLLIDENKTIYQIGPVSLMGFCEFMKLSVFIKDKEYYAFPSIILTRVDGSPRSIEEKRALAKISLVSQINAIEEEFHEEKDEHFLNFVLNFGKNLESPIRFFIKSIDANDSLLFDKFDTPVEKNLITTLNEINKNLQEIKEILRNYLKRNENKI